MGKDNQQYDARGAKSSWWHWKYDLKRSTARASRRDSKRNLEAALPRKTAGWTE